MDHSFCIHSSVDLHLGCFHVLATVNKAAVQLLQPVSSRFWSSQVRGKLVGLLHRMVAQFLLLNAAPFCSHSWLLPLYMAPAARGYTVLKNHLSFHYLWPCCWGSVDLCELKPFCRLDLHECNNSWGWAFIHFPFLGKTVSKTYFFTLSSWKICLFWIFLAIPYFCTIFLGQCPLKPWGLVNVKWPLAVGLKLPLQ